MKPFDQHQESSAEDQAALWAARLDGSSLDAADRGALEAWLAENAAHGALLAGYRQLSADLEIQLPALLSTADLAARPEKTPPRRRLSPAWAATAALVAAAGVAFTVWLARPATQVEDIATPVGQRQSFTLADGTRVELNAHTRLQVQIGAAERHVNLAEGEAFFMVKKDRARPFIVETPAGSVRVTGTTFDVRADTASELDVTVVEGHVQVNPGDGDGAGPRSPVALGAADSLSARAGTVSVERLTASDLDDALAWRQGKIVFRGVPLRDALARFGRYHGRALKATDGAASTVSIGGRYSLDDLDGFFMALREGWHVRITETPDGAVLVSLRTEP